MNTIIANARVVSPDFDLPGASVAFSGGRFTAVSPAPIPSSPQDSVVDARGSLLLPGFIDTHTHGAAGADVTDASPAAVESIAKAKLAEGCTSFLPTTLTVSRDTLLASARAVAAYRQSSPFARALGIHLEGPFINPEFSGAQNPDFVRPPSIAEVLEIDSVAPVKIVSFAPEAPGGTEFAAECIRRGIIPSAGHTGAPYSAFRSAYDAGLRRVTHFGNRMSKLHHREIGVVGAALLHKDVDLEIIADAIHLCPEMLSLVFALHPVEHVQLVTDSIRCSHLPDGTSFSMGGLPVRLENGQARLVKDGNLAGSTLRFNLGLLNLHRITGLPLKELVRVTSLNQAVALGIDGDFGRIAPGFCADFVLLNPTTFAVERVFVNGKQVF